MTVDGAPVDPAAVSDDDSYTFSNVTANHTIAVSFVPVPTYTITPTVGAHGSVSPATAQTVSSGDDASFTITPDAGYKVRDVVVDGTSVGAVTSYEFTEVTTDHTIDVSFVANVQKSSLTLSLSGLKSGVLRLGRSVTAKGTLKPIRAAAVKITVQRKVSGTWRTVTTKSRTTNATSGAYSWTYKPGKKGAYRVHTTVAKTTFYTAATSPWRTFTVK